MLRWSRSAPVHVPLAELRGLLPQGALGRVEALCVAGRLVVAVREVDARVVAAQERALHAFHGVHGALVAAAGELVVAGDAHGQADVAPDPGTASASPSASRSARA